MRTDKDLIRERFGANFGRYDTLALVQQRICATLFDKLAGTAPGLDVRRALEVGAGTGFLTSRLVGRWPDACWTINDLAPQAGEFIAKYTQGVEHACVWEDAETMDFPSGLDLVASASTMQWFERPDRFLAKARAATRTGGLLLLSTFGPENFHEIRQTTGEGLSYPSSAEVLAMVGDAGYDLLWSEEYIERMIMNTPVEVLHHIKATGVNSVSKVRWGRERLTRFARDYRDSFSLADGRVTLTYHPVMLLAVAR